MYNELKQFEQKIKLTNIIGIAMYILAIIISGLNSVLALIIVIIGLVLFIGNAIAYKKLTKKIDQYAIDKGYCNVGFKKIFVTRFTMTPVKVLRACASAEAFEVSIQEFYRGIR